MEGLIWTGRAFVFVTLSTKTLLQRHWLDPFEGGPRLSVLWLQPSGSQTLLDNAPQDIGSS